MTGIPCPECGSGASTVVDSRQVTAGVRRRRMCDICDHRWTTLETAVEMIAGRPVTERLDEMRKVLRRIARIATETDEGTE